MSMRAITVMNVATDNCLLSGWLLAPALNSCLVEGLSGTLVLFDL
jgi:hypothetical protein